MSYYLVHKFGPKHDPETDKKGFSTESDAVARACEILASGKDGDFLVEDESGTIVTDDITIRDRCKATTA